MDIGTEMTVCSSIYMKSFIMEQSLFQFLTRDDRPWFSLYFLQLDETSLMFPLSLAVHGIYTHLTQEKWKYGLFGSFLATLLEVVRLPPINCYKICTKMPIFTLISGHSHAPAVEPRLHWY